jgi:serine protease Do
MLLRVPWLSVWQRVLPEAEKEDKGREKETDLMRSMRRSALIALPLVFALGCKSSNVGANPPAKPQITETTRAPFQSPPLVAGAPDVATLVAAVKPSVVNIIVDQQVRPAASNGGGPIDPFEFFFGGRNPRGNPGGDEVFRTRAQGSGFIIDKDGDVITNAHVVEGVSEVRVKLADERELKAKVRGRDPRLDLALLQIQGGADGYPAAALGSSDGVRVGEYVIAVGNPMGLGHTVTMGIVSAKSRTIGAGPYDDFIQTDASINPGNSGGPLFNLKGEVIAINTAINPRAQNIGFAIPIDALKEVLPQLLSKGTVSRGRLGIAFQGEPMSPALAKALGLDKPRGAVVGKVEKGGPSDRAGIRSGDVILSVGNDQVNQAQELPRFVARHAPGSKVDLKVQRGTQQLTVPVTLDELKDETPTERTAPPSNAPATPSSALGISVADAPEGGALVRNVTPNGPADGSLVPGDVIVEANRSKVSNAADLAQKVKGDKNAGPILLKVEHNGSDRFVAIER